MSNRTFNAKIDGNDVVLEIKDATEEIQVEAHKVFNTAFADAIRSKAMLRDKLEDFVREQGLWDDKKEAELSRLSKEIRDGAVILSKGGINRYKAKSIAIQMRKTRAKINSLLSPRNNLDSMTAEGQADNAKFNYLVSACTVYNDTKKPVFSSLTDYLNKSGEEYAINSAVKYASVRYGVRENMEATLPENQFLFDQKFVNENLELINKEGKLVDEEGRLIDENGYYINTEGHRVDIDGNPVDKDGKLAYETLPFTDDEE